MKFSSAMALAGVAAVASAAPALERRADFCGQWDTVTSGDFTLYNNLWGEAQATSGSQCTGLDSGSGNQIAWHTSWSWTGGQGQVKSYANAQIQGGGKALSAISSMPSKWAWTCTGSDIVADIAYDIFTGKASSGTADYEIMIWVAALGGAGPISSTGSKLTTVTLAGNSWDLYEGPNGDTTVFSFVATNEVQNFNGDLMDFMNYLVQNQGLSNSQILQTINAGTEPFSGSNVKFVTSDYSISVN